MFTPEAESAASLQACRRAARALTACLATHGENPLSREQLQLIRGLLAADAACAQPVGDARRLARMVAHFFTPMQLDFATELLAEHLAGDEGEAQLIIDELEVIARESDATG
jgi:hypothetical protein